MGKVKNVRIKSWDYQDKMLRQQKVQNNKNCNTNYIYMTLYSKLLQISCFCDSFPLRPYETPNMMVLRRTRSSRALQ